MHLTNPEKLILTMLCEIHEKLDIRNDIDTKLIKSAIYNDNTWALSMKMPGIVGDSPESIPPIVNLVTRILDMWLLIEQAYEKFDQTHKDKIESDAGVYGILCKRSFVNSVTSALRTGS